MKTNIYFLLIFALKIILAALYLSQYGDKIEGFSAFVSWVLIGLMRYGVQLKNDDSYR